MSNDHDHLTDAELVAAWIDNHHAHREIEHLGAANRCFGIGMKIAEEIRSRRNGLPTLFEPLLHHADPSIRYRVSFQFRDSNPGLFRSTLLALQAEGGEIGRDATSSLNWQPFAPSVERPPIPADHPMFWQVNNSPTPAMTMTEIAQRLRNNLPDESEVLLSLAKPAIGFWPQRPRSNMPVHASRLGGTVQAPTGFLWPMAETEPMLFLGQINCADLKGLPGSEQFPSHGLMALFGDHDTINGCMFTALGGAVRYWPDVDDLSPAKPPLELSDVFLTCELDFRPLIDMPHPDSETVRAIVHDEKRRETYREFHTSF